ncbi:MAG: hypothetical protein ACYC99_16555, partial [Candidatus Geothermincolia bacterium]
MKCEFCGEEISPGALACPRCGGPISKPADQPAPGGAAQAAPPGATGSRPPVDEKPPEPPLAKLEEDFIALAEESITFDEKPNGTEILPDPSVVPAASPSIEAITGQSVPPGAQVPPEQFVMGNDLTGGYKGPESSSVAGAGVQTADDPFGLNITETSPADREPVVWERSWRYSRWWNITMMVVGIVILVLGIGAAVYFGFLRKAGPGGAPVEALRDYVTQVISGNTGNLSKVAAPGSQLAADLSSLLKGYEKYGIITVKGFEAKPIKVTNDSATVQITKLDVELQ